MNTLDAIRNRVSARAYTAQKISEENICKLLEAGMAAPVASGRYDSLWLTVVENENLLNEMSDAVTDMVEKMIGKRLDKNFGAPLMIIVSSKAVNMPGIDYANAACVLENMAIAATSMGIDNIIWSGAAAVAKEARFRNQLGIPEGFMPVLCASFGYAAKKECAHPHIIEVNRVK